MVESKNDQWAKNPWWERLYDSPAGKYYTRRCWDFIYQSLRGKQIETIIDIGGGKGRFANLLSDKGYQVTVFDIDETVLAKLKELNPKIEVISGNANDIQLDKRFDLVLSIGTLKYLDDFSIFLANVKRVLNDGGYLIIEVLNTHSLRRMIKSLFGRAERSYGVRLSPGDCVRALNKHGFKTICRRGAFWFVPPIKSKNYFLFKVGSFLEDITQVNRFVFYSPQYYIVAQLI